MQTIRLNKAEWTFDESINLGPPGGFGEVFRGLSANGPVAVKRLKLTASEAAHREMNIGESLAGRNLDYVVPVLDYGQDANSDSYFLVMPICDRSLQDEVNEKGTLTLAEARLVALDVLTGLREVGDIVHRDLKPGNVLRYQNKWCLADFGIAKFVEDSTSLRTLRNNLTPAYGAPEQWQGEAPSRATDIYALGCMLHTMLNGAPPFSGSQDQIREAHLHNPAPVLDINPRLSTFVGQMLRKAPASRPNVERCIEIISSVETANARPLHAGLIAAAGQVARESALTEAAANAAATAERQRQQMITEANADLQGIIKRLFGAVTAASDETQVDKHSIKLGRGLLSFITPSDVTPARQEIHGSSPSWEIIACAALSVTREKLSVPLSRNESMSMMYSAFSGPDHHDYTWSATLFFGKSNQDPNYRWRETAFWSFNNSQNREEPFALRPDDRDFAIAFSKTMGTVNTAYGPLTIDGEDEDQFQHRWLTLFSKAVQGVLSRPNQMPITDHFWK